MKSNVGTADRIIRILISAILAGLFFSGKVTGTLGIIMVVAAGIFTITAAIGFCPLYKLVGLSTCPVKKS
ncbi:MAG: DUF2892 domain-containing protein [Flavobacteriales bacterium]